MVGINTPGRYIFTREHILLDVNGTIAPADVIIDEVKNKLAELSKNVRLRNHRQYPGQRPVPTTGARHRATRYKPWQGGNVIAIAGKTCWKRKVHCHRQWGKWCVNTKAVRHRRLRYR